MRQRQSIRAIGFLAACAAVLVVFAPTLAGLAALFASRPWTATAVLFWALVPLAFARAGERDSTLHYLEGADVTSYDTSIALYEIGDHDAAFAALETALEAEPLQLNRIDRDPSADNMREDPRYAALVERFGSN